MSVNNHSVDTVERQFQQFYRQHFGQLVASITRLTGDISRAEDVAHDTFLKAMQKWPVGDYPEHAPAWLMTTARNAAFDLLRRNKSWDQRVDELTIMQELYADPVSDQQQSAALDDDMLRLIFTCCHPALNIEARVALCLTTVCGLSTESVAKAFILPAATMSQRLWRAKSKIRDAGISYRVPEEDELEARLNDVLAVLYLIFNEGWLPALGEQGLELGLSNEAIRLTRLLHVEYQSASELLALLALLLIQNSRRDTRFSANGDLVRLADQDRGAWHKEEIQAATKLLTGVFAAGAGNARYALMAAIAATHANTPQAKQTDWAEIIKLYAALMELDPSPVIALNHAVAVGELDGAAAGLQAVERISESKMMQRYYLYHAARAEFLLRLKRREEAATAYRAADQLCSNAVEKRFLRQQLALATAGSP